MKIFKIWLILSVVIIALPSLNLIAHGSGASFEKVVGEYLIDVGYEPAERIEGDSQRFDFNVYNENNKKEV